MRRTRERWFTFTACGACAFLAALQLWPRMAVQQADVEFHAERVRVAVEGAVTRPGEYALPFGSTVGDLLTVAGGFAGEAERSLVNLADPLSHGELVVVPRARSASGDLRIDLNAASVEELQRLPGVGPVTADRIIAGRPYSALEDLLAVRGIGPKTLERIRTRVRL